MRGTLPVPRKSNLPVPPLEAFPDGSPVELYINVIYDRFSPDFPSHAAARMHVQALPDANALQALGAHLDVGGRDPPIWSRAFTIEEVPSQGTGRLQRISRSRHLWCACTTTIGNGRTAPVTR